MTIKEMQKQIESMMPTPKQILEHIDKELEEKRERIVHNKIISNIKLYIGVNSDGTGIISKFPLKRFFDKDTNREDVISFKDTEQPPHWIVDYSQTDTVFGRYGHAPIDEFLTLPAEGIKKLLNIELTWNDECIIIEI